VRGILCDKNCRESAEKGKIAGYSIFAHSRPDKIGTPRLLPLYI
jgi:hypothetical protein